MIEFVIPGPPVGKARPRVANGHAYTPAPTREYEAKVRAAWRAARLPTFGPLTPVYAQVTAYYPIPASASKADREIMAQNIVLPMKTPDADNFAKIVLDALNGLAYADDKQVVHLEAIKLYAAVPHVHVALMRKEVHE